MHNWAVAEAVGSVPVRVEVGNPTFSIAVLGEGQKMPWKEPKVAQRWALENLRGKYRNGATQSEFVVNAGTIKHSFNHSKMNGQKIRVLEAIGDLIREARPLNPEKHYTRGIRKGVEADQIFYAPLVVDGALRVARLVVHRMDALSQGERQVYDVRSVEIGEAQLLRGPFPEVSRATNPDMLRFPFKLPNFDSLVKQSYPKDFEGGRISHSIAQADYLTNLSTALDAMRKSPKERLEFAEKAKAKLANLRVVRDELYRKLKDGGHQERFNKEAQRRIDDLKAAHEVEVRQIDEQMAADLENATTKQEQNAIRLGAQSRKAAAARRLDDGIAKLTGRTVDRAKMLQALAELDAVLMALPPEVRGKIGGFTQLAKLKTDKARARFFLERLQKIDDALETHLKKEYRGKIDKLLDKAQPKKGENRVQKSNLGPEVQESVQEGERVAVMMEDQLASELSMLEAEMLKPDLGAKELALVLERWGLANTFGNLDGRSAAELAAAAEQLEALISKGRNEWRIQEEARLAEVKAKREKVLSELKRPHGVSDSDLQAAKERGRSAGQKVLDFIESNLSFSQTLQELFRNARSEMALYFEDKVRLANNAYTAGA